MLEADQNIRREAGGLEEAGGPRNAVDVEALDASREADDEVTDADGVGARAGARGVDAGDPATIGDEEVLVVDDDDDAPLSALDVEALDASSLGHDEARVVDGELRKLARADGLIDLCLAGALDQIKERQLHLQVGYASIGDYGRECLGVSASQARQLARLGAALRRLPLLAVAMRQGDVTLAQARLLIRVLDPREEDQQRVWLSIARQCTVRKLAGRVKQEVAAREQAARARRAPGARGRAGSEGEDSAAADGCAARRGGHPGPDEGGGDQRGRSEGCAAANVCTAGQGDDPGGRGEGEGGENQENEPEAGAPEPRFDVSIAIPPALYRMVAFVRYLAELQVGRKLSTGAALEFVFAEALGSHLQQVSAEQEQAIEEQVAAEAARRHVCARRGDALGRLLEQSTGCWELLCWTAPRVELGAWMEHLPREADALHGLLLRVARVRTRLRWTLGRLALLMRRARLWQRLGFGSLAQYVTERLGIGERTFRNLVRLAGDAQQLPALDAALRQGQVGACAARRVARVATRQTEASWVDYARAMTYRALEAETRPVIDLPAVMANTSAPRRTFRTGQLALTADPGGADAGAADAGAADRQMCAADEHGATDPWGLELELDERGQVRLTPLELSLSQEGYTCWRLALRAGRALLGPDVPEWVCLYGMLSLCAHVWELDEDRRAFAHILQRDGYQCTAPGCTCSAGIHVHHIVFRSHGGTDADSNLTTACFWHHIEGLHAGHVRCWGSAPHALVWELGGQRFEGDHRCGPATGLGREPEPDPMDGAAVRGAN